MIPLDRKAGHEGMIDPRDMAGYGKKKPTSEPTLISKTITDNGIYNATDDSADGYSSVDVNIGASENMIEKTSIMSQGFKLIDLYSSAYDTVVLGFISTEEENGGVYTVPTFRRDTGGTSNCTWYYIILPKANKIISAGSDPGIVNYFIFTPGDNYIGVFDSYGTTEYTNTGSVVPTSNDGKWYVCAITTSSGTSETTYSLTEVSMFNTL